MNVRSFGSRTAQRLVALGSFEIGVDLIFRVGMSEGCFGSGRELEIGSLPAARPAARAGWR